MHTVPNFAEKERKGVQGGQKGENCKAEEQDSGMAQGREEGGQQSSSQSLPTVIGRFIQGIGKRKCRGRTEGCAVG